MPLDARPPMEQIISNLFWINGQPFPITFYYEKSLKFIPMNRSSLIIFTFVLHVDLSVLRDPFHFRFPCRFHLHRRHSVPHLAAMDPS